MTEEENTILKDDDEQKREAKELWFGIESGRVAFGKRDLAEVYDTLSVDEMDEISELAKKHEIKN